MLNITISKERTIVENTKYELPWIIKTENFFGDVLFSLEEHFPNFSAKKLASKIVFRIRKKINNEPLDDDYTVFGCTELGTSLYNLLDFVNQKETLVLTLNDIERIRIENHMKATYLPVNFEGNESMRFEGLKTVTEIVIAALYYYAYNEYKLVRCQHCGKWFATTTRKEKYCKRISPCFGIIVKGKTPLVCEETVRNIQQKQRRRHRNIYSYLDAYAEKEEDFEYFKQESKRLRETITRSPSVENFNTYEDFLNQYPKRMVKK